MEKPICIIGHRNPDTDSICAAISLAELLKQQGKQVLACRQGPLNEETKFALRYFGETEKEPFLLTDARLTLAELDLEEPVLITPGTTIHEAWETMITQGYRSLIVLDDQQKPIGICTMSNLSEFRLRGREELQRLIATATLEQIAKTIEGTIVQASEPFHQNGDITIITLEESQAAPYVLADGITILSSGADKQHMIIDQGTACMVITCGVHVDQKVKDHAAEKHCAIIETQLTTMQTARRISESYDVENVMSTSLMCFSENEYVNDVAAKMANKRYRNYPVLDADGYVRAVISRYNTMDYQPRQVILVDHSTSTQTLKNIEEAHLVAVIDHHHLGDLQTSYPVYYRNETIGCTCSIIARMYQEAGLQPDKGIAGLMLSAILSDTLGFQSTTTTDQDRRMAEWLAGLAGIDKIEDYARDLLGASVALMDSTPEEILNRDLKNYEIGRYRVAIGQTNYKKLSEVQKILKEFRRTLEAKQKSQNLDLLIMCFTDVMGGGSFLVYDGPMRTVMPQILETVIDEHSGFDSHIISRKQQLVPRLSDALTKQ